MTRKPTPVTILDAVLGTTLIPAEAPVHAVHLVNLTRLEDNPYQTRQRNDPDHVLNLAASLIAMAPTLPATAGLQQIPIGRLVRYADGHVYPADTYANPTRLAHLIDDPETIVELAFGHSRRLAFLCLANGPGHVFKELDQSRLDEWTAGRAYDAAAYRTMPVHLAHLTDQQMWEHAITENAQRLGLTPIEEAIAIERARKEFNMTYDQAGALFGKSRGAAANLVRLLQLPDDVQQMVMDGQLTERHGRELVALTADPQRLRNIANQAVKYNHTVKSLADSVKHEAKRIAEDQERTRQIAKAQQILAAGYVPFGIGAPLPADRLDLELGSWNGHMLTATDAGRCSADCPCLKVIHRSWQIDGMIAIDPDTPNMALCCANPDRHRKLAESVPPTAAAQEAQAAAVADKQRQLTEQVAQQQAAFDLIVAEADRIWSEVLERCDRTVLWNHIEFWQTLNRRGNFSWKLEGWIKDAATTPAIVDNALLWLKSSHQEYIADAGRTTFNVEKLRKSAKHLLKIGAKLHRPHPTRDATAAAFREWVADAQPTNDDLIAMRDQEFRHPGFAPMVSAIMDKLGTTVGIDSKWLEELIDEHVAQSPISNLHSWTDDDETSHQCLMSEWDGRNWATLAKLAYTCATDPAAPCTITPAVARRLAADCPNPDDKASLLMTADRLDRDGPP